MSKDKHIPTDIIAISENLTEVSIRGGDYVSAGFPSEAFNYTEDPIDFNKYILRKKKSTKCVWATNNNMTGIGIELGDMIVIEENKKPSKSSIYLFRLDGELRLSKAERHTDHIELIPIRDGESSIKYQGEDLTMIGIVTHIVKRFPVKRNIFSDYNDRVMDYVKDGMDFNDYILEDSWWETVFFLWTGGESMNGYGINKGDLLVIDMLKDHTENSIMVFDLNNEFTLKRIRIKGENRELVSSNPEIPPIEIKPGDKLKKWGVLISVIKKVK